MKQKIIELAIIFAVFFLPGYVFQSTAAAETSAQFSAMILTYLIIALPQVLLLLYLIWIQKSPSLEDFGVVKPTRKILYALPVFLGAFAIITPLLLLLSFLPEQVKDQITTQAPWRIQSLGQIPLVALFCLVVGYREELFFRSYLLTRFSELSLNRHVAALISSTIFGGAHLYQNIFGFLVTFMLGLFFCYVFYEWKNIHIIALAHAAYNLTLFLINV
ncbi:MAG: CPBP family intramembrane metalloprotease [Spirochaetales bacterium]|nr:CPBP family intramembrane metalloprotease [Spirochaetales bacterium]